MSCQLEMLPLKTLIDFLAVAMLGRQRQIAVLCRTNGQALVVSNELHEAGINHRLQRRAVDRAVGPWLADTFGLYPGYEVDRPHFLELVEASILKPMLDPAEAWFSLRRSADAAGKTVDLCKLATAVRCGRIADELNETPQASLVVSTIHRAKGLEFDDVFIVEFDENAQDDEEFAEEARLLYVALTRARDRLTMLECVKKWGLTHAKSRDDRWELRGTGTGKWKRLGIEFVGNDVDKESPAVGFEGMATNATDLHDYLIEHVAPGDAVSLALVSASPFAQATYDVRHGDRVVGRTSKNFAEVLDRFLGHHKQYEERHYPPRIDALHVEMLDSVAGTPADAKRFGTGPSALWLRPRLAGLLVNVGQRVAGPVDEQLLAGPMVLAHDDVDAVPPGAIALGEPGVAVAVGMISPVLGPDQAQGEVLVTAQLLVHLGPVGLARVAYRLVAVTVEALLELGVARAVRQRPGEAGKLSPGEEPRHRRVRDADGTGDGAS